MSILMLGEWSAVHLNGPFRLFSYVGFGEQVLVTEVEVMKDNGMMFRRGDWVGEVGGLEHRWDEIVLGRIKNRLDLEGTRLVG